MGFRKKHVEAPVQRPRPKELSKPLSEKQLFFRDHINLDMDMREIRMLFSLAEEGEDIQDDLTLLTKEIVIRLAKQFGDGTAELENAKKYLLDRVIPASVGVDESNPKLAELQTSFIESFLLSDSLESLFRQEVKEGKEELKTVDEFFEKLPTFEKDLDQILVVIRDGLQSNTIKEKNPMIESLINGFLSELKELQLDPELQESLFTTIAQRIALAWGHNPLVAESMSKDYLLVKQLGYGTNGEAYSALSATGEQVAMKILSPRNPETNERVDIIDKDAARQFQRELYVLEQVEDDHLVEYKKGMVIPVERTMEGQAAHTGWVAMEFIDGEDLKAESDHTKKYQIQDVLDLSAQAFSGMQVLHEAGIVHRDIKPHNMMIERSSGKPVVKLIDFGVAINVDQPFDVDKNEEQGLYGSPLYMAPELVSEEITPKVDVFSMGVIMYELLTKQHPFVDKLSSKEMTLNSILVDIAENTAIPPRSLRSGVSQELSDLIMRMLNKDPKKRPSASQARAVLESMLSGMEPVEETINHSLAETTAIPAYGRSEVLKSAQYEETQKIELPDEKEKKVLTLRESAIAVINQYPYRSLTRTAFKLDMERSIGAIIPDEEITEMIAYLKEQNKIQDNASSNEGYIVVKNFENDVKQQIEQITNAPQSSDVDFDDFDDDIFGEQTRVLYEEQGVSLDLARQFLSANREGNLSQLQSDLSMTADATRQLLEQLNEDKFLSYDPDKGSYKVGKPKPPSLLSKLRSFFQ